MYAYNSVVIYCKPWKFHTKNTIGMLVKKKKKRYKSSNVDYMKWPLVGIHF